jgi:hypothetical protein
MIGKDRAFSPEVQVMRSIEIEEGLRIRFPSQDLSFDAGVEIGIIASLMGGKLREFTRCIGAGSVEQARLLARKLGYHLCEIEDGPEGTARVTFRVRSAAPKLRLVASRN